MNAEEEPRTNWRLKETKKKKKRVNMARPSQSLVFFQAATSRLVSSRLVWSVLVKSVHPVSYSSFVCCCLSLLLIVSSLLWNNRKVMLLLLFLLRPSRGQQSSSARSRLRGSSPLPQRLLESLSIRVVASQQRLPLLLLLLVQDPQEVTQLGDGEGVPLPRRERLVRFLVFLLD